jgi:hypothetical protein
MLLALAVPVPFATAAARLLPLAFASRHCVACALKEPRAWAKPKLFLHPAQLQPLPPAEVLESEEPKA